MVLSFLLLELKKNQFSRYEEQLKMANIDKTREYYEELIYKIQSELMENERRWNDVNHLIINGQSNQALLDKNQSIIATNVFLENIGIDLNKIKVNKKSVFVLTPFLNEERETFLEIKNICASVDLNCTRGDEVYRERDILSHTISSILESSIIIANINGRNPNVFYELGICHAIGKPVILISKTKNELPFDIKNKNIIFYESLQDLNRKLTDELLRIFINK